MPCRGFDVSHLGRSRRRPGKPGLSRHGVTCSAISATATIAPTPAHATSRRLALVEADGSAADAAEDVAVPNGLGYHHWRTPLSGTGMADDFDPPLELRGIVIITLEDAQAFVRWHKDTRVPMSKEIVRHRLQTAATLEQRKLAADAFRIWADAEGLLSEP
jgi:hypothetical protein